MIVRGVVRSFLLVLIGLIVLEGALAYQITYAPQTIGPLTGAVTSDIDQADALVRGVPSPSVQLTLSEEPSCDFEEVLFIRNTGTEEKDDAANIQVGYNILAGGSFLDRVIYNPLVGDLQDGATADVPFELVVNEDFYTQPIGTQIKIEWVIANEDNRPDHIEGRRIVFTLNRCESQQSEDLCIPSPETCNNIDDDCDGQVDEDIYERCGLTDIGTCSLGYRSCTEGAFGRCVGEIIPDIEICNGLDDDCDGQVDEGLTRACGSDEGVCSTGTETCTNGQWGSCTGTFFGPQTETCNGVDDDCDGQIDNGITCECIEGTTRSCGSDVGACEAGTQLCTGGSWGSCIGGVGPEPETCDSWDNDCDGQVDENLVRNCGQSDAGVCSFGTQSCTLGGWGLCTGAIFPIEEICDAKDNDCDGKIDEAVSQRCGVTDVGQCTYGEKLCSEGRFSECIGAILPSLEICDGLDNDCDGHVDENLQCDCTEGETQRCGTDEGVCRSGVQTCEGGSWGLCIGDIEGHDETCDGLDNDCDGEIDENIPILKRGILMGECRPEQSQCINGQMVVIEEGVLPQTEVCDGVDNDCDFEVDEELDTYVGSDVGECTKRLEKCIGGQMIPVTRGTLPKTEVCNGLDDDCDGTIDEEISCVCTDGETRSCGTDIGACSLGTQTCIQGAWGACQGQIVSQLETCDGIDNDCDGTIDEDVPDRVSGSSQGVCSSSLERCVGGQFVTITQASSGSNEVCDGLDNDCDGQTDEGLPQIRTGTDTGACQAEVQACINGQMSMMTPGIGPSTEVCDGIDNDCDGLVDEEISDRSEGTLQGQCTPVVSRCQSGQFVVIDPGVGPSAEVCDGIDNDCDGVVDEDLTQQCGSDVGQCSFGTKTCSEGAWGACIGEVLATAETCDGVDNDCDGQVDEALIQTCGSAVGVCQQGTQQCINGAFGVCEGSVNPGAELCDGLDNDCNGLVDDGVSCECTNGETRSCGTDTGSCIAGSQTCVGGQWGLCIGAVEGTDEVCDGIDNDCDGVVDEQLVQLFGQDTGTCEQGVKECINGVFAVTTPSIDPSIEVCDGVDNDCDGQVDEDLVRTCGETDVGSCSFGLQRCVSGDWGSCEGAVGPSLEFCDGKDNDCNGEIDEDLPQVLSGSRIGECTQEVSSCILGQMQVTRAATLPVAERCDGLDNDCDGLVDEDIQDIITGTDVGACEVTVTSCTQGTFLISTAGVEPIQEQCNGIDDDCDGQIDEAMDCECLNGETRSCGSDIGACVSGTQTCIGGSWGSCEGMIDGSSETCNGIDDDCDGQIDEDQPRLLDGLAVGVCQSQVTECVSGSMKVTQEAISPSLETCDGLDNDCDGEVDEDQPYEFVGSDVGQCVPEVYGCVDGTRSLLREQIGPGDEVCDGIDNDCDGEVDEDIADKIQGSEAGQCRPQITRCESGQFVIVQRAIESSAEVCDGLDNDCDGMIDEQIPAIEAGTDVGECRKEIKLCGAGTFIISQAAKEPSPEICDGLDNDCDGDIDDGIDCSCLNGETRSCGSDEGVCGAGTQTCINGNWDSCKGETLGSEELCDGLDNDCDGEIDEGLSALFEGVQIGRCTPEVTSCVDGKMKVTQAATYPSIEICNGIDDDCDGLIDEDLTHIENTTSIGECQQEKWECLAGNMTVTQPAIFPQREACNKLDDDCDGLIDEGCPGPTVFADELIDTTDLPPLGGIEDADTEEPESREPEQESTPPQESTTTAPSPSSKPAEPPVVVPRRKSKKKSVVATQRPAPLQRPAVAIKSPVRLSPIKKASATTPMLQVPLKGESSQIQQGSKTRLGIDLIMGKGPASISPADPSVTISAVIKNTGNKPLSDITLASFSNTPYWRPSPFKVSELAPGEQKAVSFTLYNAYCSQNIGEGEYRFPLTDIDVRFVAEESTQVSDESTLRIPVRTDPLTIATAPQNYAHNQTMKVCYFVGNKAVGPKDRLEIEFELFDRQDDIIIDYLTPIRVGPEEILLKVKDYELYNIPRQKEYHLRGFLFENGSIFAPTYLVGEDRTIVDLSDIEHQDLTFWGYWERLMEVFR